MSELHLQVCGGFGNRLRALISGICWAEDLGRTLHVWWWSLDRACPCAFEKLIDISSLPSWVHLHPGKIEEAIECLQADEFVKAGYPTYVKSYGHFHSSDPERWLKYLRSLRPVPSITERVALIPRQNAIGIHIRRGDNLKAAEESPLSAYIDEIWTHHRNACPFVIATDCPQAQYVLLCLLQDKCLFPARNMHRFSEQGIYEAVVDFFSLARCPTILGSAHSSFTDMAAAYGSATLKIIRAS